MARSFIPDEWLPDITQIHSNTQTYTFRDTRVLLPKYHTTPFGAVRFYCSETFPPFGSALIPSACRLGLDFPPRFFYPFRLEGFLFCPFGQFFLPLLGFILWGLKGGFGGPPFFPRTFFGGFSP